MQTGAGLGRDMSSLSDAQIVAYQKVCACCLVFNLVCCVVSTILRCQTSSASSRVHFETRRSCSQAEYANKLLYIATLALAKLSIISLLMILTASNLHRRLGWVLTALIAVWGLVTEIVAAFQCGTTIPWRFLGEEAHCLSMVRWFMAKHE